MYLYQGSATLDGVEISDNTAMHGGGVLVMESSATLTMSGGQIISNSAISGGGVHVYAVNATFTQTGVSTIAHNTAISKFDTGPASATNAISRFG